MILSIIILIFIFFMFILIRKLIIDSIYIKKQREMLEDIYFQIDQGFEFMYVEYFLPYFESTTSISDQQENEIHEMFINLIFDLISDEQEYFINNHYGKQKFVNYLNIYIKNHIKKLIADQVTNISYQETELNDERGLR